MLKHLVPEDANQKIAEQQPEYIEDARNALFSLTDRDALIATTLEWITSSKILVYHGTRLTDTELDSVLAEGLLPLTASARRSRLVRALSTHPRWQEIEGRLDKEIQAHGRGHKAGDREGQVHLTLSEAGLRQSFNHYLTHGSEFDQHVAHALLGFEGEKALMLDGKARVVRVEVQGAVALQAANPYAEPDELRRRGDMPALAKQFLTTWSFWLIDKSFQTTSLQEDCGLVFDSVVPASWIVNVETINSSTRADPT